MAGAMGGALVGRPRQERIFLMTSGVSIAASILIRAPQRGHASTSNSNSGFGVGSSAYNGVLAARTIVRDLK
jgi:hypothetical protein